jgi:hypothetical protein
MRMKRTRSRRPLQRCSPLIVLSLVLVACRASDAERPNAPASADRENSAPATSSPAARPEPDVTGGQAEPADEACMKACLDRHQAQAVAFEVIEASCRRTCAEEG